MKTLRRCLTPLLACLAACSSPEVDPSLEAPSGDAKTASATAPIVGGIPSTEDQNFVVYVNLADMGDSAICSGVLVAPRLIMTALHCVALVDKGDESCGPTGFHVFGTIEPKGLRIFSGLTRPGPTKQPLRNVVKIITADTLNVCTHDFVFLELDGPLPNTPTVPLRLDSPPVVGEPFTAIGYGVYNSDSGIPKQRQQKTDMTVKMIGPGTYQGQSGGVVLDVPENNIMSIQGPCEGDSGGAAFSQNTKAVFAILSATASFIPSDPNHLTAQCTAGVSYYMQLPNHHDAILKAFSQVGYSPWLEGKPKPAPVGSPCETASDCEIALCVNKICTMKCDGVMDPGTGAGGAAGAGGSAGAGGAGAAGAGAAGASGGAGATASAGASGASGAAGAAGAAGSAGAGPILALCPVGLECSDTGDGNGTICRAPGGAGGAGGGEQAGAAGASGGAGEAGSGQAGGGGGEAGAAGAAGEVGSAGAAGDVGSAGAPGSAGGAGEASAGAAGSASGQLGATCQVGADCATGLCIASGDSSICSMLCDTAACPADWTCEDISGKRVCLRNEPVADPDSSCAFGATERGGGKLAAGALALALFAARARRGRRAARGA